MTEHIDDIEINDSRCVECNRTDLPDEEMGALVNICKDCLEELDN